MAEALVNLLLEELFTVAFDHTKEAVTLVLTAKTEVQNFSSNLKAIQAVLEDAEKQQVEKASVRIWLDGLNDVSYEMVDVLDKWNTEILKQKAKGVTTEKKKTFKKVCFSIPSNCFCFGLVNKASHLYKIATEIKELNEKLSSIAAQKKDFQFHESSISIVEQVNQRLETSSFVDISTIFGREEATFDLLNKLLSDSSEEGEKVLVVPIVGMGGMGKTTLAKLAYNHQNVKTYFEKRIWVCVSDPFDVVKIAKAIISGTGNEAPNSTVLQEVLQRMYESLEKKKFLIVLDDVWTEEETKWDNLQLSVIMQSNCAKGSRILVTTRKKGVAEMMKADAHMIQIEKLSDKICFELFGSIAFLNREEDKAKGFGDIGEKIVEKCDGLPLAIKCLGNLMHRKKTIGEWQDVLDSKIWVLKEVERDVFRPLLVSYYELDPVVKRCLLYCATFPKDYRFNKHNLIELWMSQDYLSGKDYKGKEKTGQYVFDTLVMRSFFQDVVEEVDFHKCIIEFCKMHDIVHDFVQFLNKNECFTTEPKEANARLMVIGEEVRHLSLMYVPYGSPLLEFVSPVNCKKLRTLATFDSEMRRIDIKVISQLRCLRTLNLSDTDIRELPEDIGHELIHLRYLDLSGNRGLQKLPDSVGNLYNLQTLGLSCCRNLVILPENMGNLINLRHLHTKDCNKLEYLPRGIGRLTSLQTLNTCPVNHDEGLQLEDLGSLDQLQGFLFIDIKGSLKDTISSEAQKARLNSKKLCRLGLRFPTLDKQSHVQLLEALRPHQDLKTLDIFSYGGNTEPSWMISLQNLRSLSLVRWDGCEYLPPLGKLPFLEELSVDEMEKVRTVGDEFLGISITGTQTSSSSVLFPKLEQLTFWFMPEWEQWEGVGGRTESGGAHEITIMPRLVEFTICDCRKLMNLPLFLQKTPLRKVLISGCRRSIITTVWPDNCEVRIAAESVDPEIPNITERVETEIQRDDRVDHHVT